MARRKSSTSRRHLAVTLRLSPQEYQLVSYAASKSRARSVPGWVRDRLLAAAREKVPAKTAEQILAGTAVVPLLRESLKEARGAGRARVLTFRRNSSSKEQT
jgi:hypothetical protein